MCVPVCALHVCVFVFYLDRVCKMRTDLRNYSTYGVNIPYDSRYHQHTTKPATSTFYGIFMQIGHKSERNSHQLVMHVISSLHWKMDFFFLPQLKTILELYTICHTKGTLESWILAGIRRRIPLRALE